MEIKDTTTGKFVPLEGAFNFDYAPSRTAGIPNAFSFGIDWTREGAGQDILREHIRFGSSMSVRERGREYRGIPQDVGGFNTPDGSVFVPIAQ
jgi:hypothetical protein